MHGAHYPRRPDDTRCAALGATPVKVGVSGFDRAALHTRDPRALHGGAWTYFDNRSYRSIARRFARSGYVVGNMNYPLVPDGVFPNSVHDVAYALAYLQNHADELGLDPTRIAVMGYSAGAHLATLVAVEPGDPRLAPDCAEGSPTRPAAIVSGAGPMDMRGLRDADLVRRFMGSREQDIPVADA